MKILHYTLLLCFVAMNATAKMPPLYPRQDCGLLETQIDMNICACNNRDAADKVLNETYQRVMLLMPNKQAKNNLTKAERAWIKKRDKVCHDKVGNREDSGTIWDLEMCECLEDMTVNRIRELNTEHPATIDQLD
ncbi:MAG: lysozyme inhibitor LprI family protein [Pseudomonadota bacterium]|nr:lysozyme inhibitor LprI family protein [Pseudomonadota bacterium]